MGYISQTAVDVLKASQNQFKGSDKKERRTLEILESRLRQMVKLNCVCMFS